jgi:hypothetical protein
MSLMSIFAAAIAIVVSTALLDSFQGGNKGFSQVKKRTSAIDDFIAK